MTNESGVLVREPEAPQEDLAGTRDRLLGRLENLEQGIKDSWHSANAAVVGSVENTMATVESAAHAVQGAVQGTSEAMERALDLPGRMRWRSWLLVGGAVLVGVLASRFVRRRRRRTAG